MLTDAARRQFLAGSLAVLGTAWLDGPEPSAAAAPIAAAPADTNLSAVKAAVFDTFGTVVDYRSSIIAEGEALGKAKGLKVDWAKFADTWRGGYGPAMNRVRTG